MRNILRVGAAGLTVLAATALGTGSALAAPAAPASGTVVTVSPSQSIQAAVDAASPGTTIQLQPGTYTQTVTISTDGITLKGAGSGTGGTILEPPATMPSDFCATVPPEPVPGHGGGVCVLGQFTVSPEAILGYVSNVTVTGIRFENWPGDGVSLVATRDATVSGNVMTGSGAYGLADNASIGDVLSGNVISGGARAGIFYSSAGGTISGNDVSNAGFGIAVQDSSGFRVTGNDSHGNCDGYLVFDTSAAAAGGDDSVVSGNVFAANNESCAGIPSVGFPTIQGTGMVMVGPTDTTVSANVITGNSGSQPLSGGIAVVSGAPYLGGPAEQSVQFTGNSLSGNSPRDLLWDGDGTAVSFTGNSCGSSSPSGLCAS